MVEKVIDKTDWNYTIIENRIVETERLDIYEKMLYIALKRFTNIQTGEAFPGVKRVAELSGMSERKARNVISALAEKGYIHVEHRKNKTSIYTLLSIPAQYAGEASHAGGHAPGAGEGVHEVQVGGARGADELKKHELKKQEQEKHNKKGDVANAPDFSPDDLFEEWWSYYANKVGDKKKCRARYKTLLKKNKHEEIMNGTSRYRDYLAALKARGEFAPNPKHPLTFLNGENFKDEYEKTEGGGNSATNQRSNGPIAGTSYEDVIAAAERGKKAWGG